SMIESISFMSAVSSRLSVPSVTLEVTWPRRRSASRGNSMRGRTYGFAARPRKTGSPMDGVHLTRSVRRSIAKSLRVIALFRCFQRSKDRLNRRSVRLVLVVIDDGDQDDALLARRRAGDEHDDIELRRPARYADALDPGALQLVDLELLRAVDPLEPLNRRVQLTFQLGERGLHVGRLDDPQDDRDLVVRRHRAHELVLGVDLPLLRNRDRDLAGVALVDI